MLRCQWTMSIDRYDVYQPQFFSDPSKMKLNCLLGYRNRKVGITRKKLP